MSSHLVAVWHCGSPALVRPNIRFLGDFHSPLELWFCCWVWFPVRGSATGNVQLHDQEQDTSHDTAGSQPLGCFTVISKPFTSIPPQSHLDSYSEYCICV